MADAPPAFVTGGAGFAGRFLVAELGERAVAPARSELDLLDAGAVRSALGGAGPARVFHLAAHASVGLSWKDPETVLRENVTMTLNLLEAVRLEAPEAIVVLASSGEIYGPPERLPVDESAPLRPQNPYAVSKAACDLLAGQYADAHGLRVIRARAFNQAGPGQSDEYVVGTIARQVAEAELAGADEAVVITGNPDAARDFLDVRDAARAYVAAAEAPAGAYNVCSGTAITVREVVELAGRVASVGVRHEIDPERVRPHDVPEVRGSAERLASASGWAPEITLERTVADAIAG
ncbi:MAG TPA: GDP-mannose 4,6-dehydratase, partial [Thermoleophilaceae bacterium]|nr:GDP-mannose 4,6-dehydratase [Thermoleophilaceae bacterium]